MKFFLDNNVSPQHAEALRLYVREDAAELVHLKEKFEPNTPDPEWISVLAAEGDWILISGDIEISRKPVNRRAWHESGLTAFFCCEAWARANQIKQGEWLLHWWPEILRQARATPSGHGFKMPKGSSTFVQIYPDSSRK